MSNNAIGIKTESGVEIQIEETETELRAQVKDSEGNEMWFIAFSSQNGDKPSLWVDSPTHLAKLREEDEKK